MKYYINRGERKPLEVEYDGDPPCLFCNEPVTSPSTDGPLICGACDCGMNKDGTTWTNEQSSERWANRESKIKEIINAS